MSNKSLYDVDTEALKVVAEILRRRAKDLADRAEEVRQWDKEWGRRLAFATAALLNAIEDITAVIEERGPESLLSPKARREVENLINDALIDIKNQNKRGDESGHVDQNTH